MAATTFLDVLSTSAHSPRGISFASSPTLTERIEYAELDAQARSRAVELTARGFGPGDIALLAFSAGLNVLRGLTAALYAGLAVSPVAVTASSPASVIVERMLTMLRHSGARLILTDTTTWALLSAELPDGLDGVTVHLVDADVIEAGTDWRRPAIGPDSLAILQYTSGSTGSPKGVMVNHSNLLANQAVIGTALHTTSESVSVGWLPHYHDMGLIGLLLHPIYARMESILTSPVQFLKRPAFWLRLMTEHRASVTVAPDFAYAMCTRLITDTVLAELDLSALEIAVTGAEPVRARTLEQFAERFAPAGFRADAFRPAYGMAETTLLVSGFRAGGPVRTHRADAETLAAGEVAEAADTQAADGATVLDIVSCGAIAEGHTVAVVDPASSTRLEPGRIGELWVRGPSVSPGYWRDPEATEAEFGAVLEGGGGERYLRTGDLGAVIDGELVVTGRIKDLLIVRGKNVYPQDVEERAAALLPELVGLSAAAFPHGTQGEGIALLLEVDQRGLAQPGMAEGLSRARLTLVREFGLPSLDVVTVRRGTLPRTTSGKIRRSQARALFEEDALNRVLLPGATA